MNYIKLNNISNNSNVLLLLHNEIDIINIFSHIIKKKNINLFINNLTQNIKGEECENNINIFKDLNDIKNIIFNNIIICDITTYDFLQNIKNIINNDTLIHIYTDLSNENIKNITFKNYIRKITKTKYNPLLPLNDLIQNIENNNYNILSLKIHKSNNYIIYGNNNTYEIIIKMRLF